jgi:tripeptidyl-peptidase-1
MIDWVFNVSDRSKPHTDLYNVFNTEAMKLGLRGITIVAATGDNGALSSSSSCNYVPTFPASSPYVTAVGATQGIESGTTEVVCQGDPGGIITSGGGFSQANKRPNPTFERFT